MFGAGLHACQAATLGREVTRRDKRIGQVDVWQPGNPGNPARRTPRWRRRSRTVREDGRPREGEAIPPKSLGEGTSGRPSPRASWPARSSPCPLWTDSLGNKGFGYFPDRRSGLTTSRRLRNFVQPRLGEAPSTWGSTVTRPLGRRTSVTSRTVDQVLGFCPTAR